MSVRPTADIRDDWYGFCSTRGRMLTAQDAIDSLTARDDEISQLDAEVNRLLNRCAEYQVAAVRQRIAFTDPLPPGVSFERVIAIAKGVINDVDEHGTNDWQSIRDYLLHAELSSVKP